MAFSQTLGKTRKSILYKPEKSHGHGWTLTLGEGVVLEVSFDFCHKFCHKLIFKLTKLAIILILFPYSLRSAKAPIGLSLLATLLELDLGKEMSKRPA